MASSLAREDRPDLIASDNHDAADDPFVTTSTNATAHHRFSNFDEQLFASGPGSSPTQAKRALEAHLAETDRRLDEAGKLGTALVSQRKVLAEQLVQVQKLKTEGELGPDLRRKLVEIERDFNDLARETARVFLPRQRVPSNEAQSGSPFVPEARSGRRSVSPSKFESHATGSPTKLSVPNRKLRNQSSNRVHDIEFAAEISTSLIAQVRNLQSLLSERESEVKDIQSDRDRLEREAESLQQRLKILDESEHRYKEENWNLETRLQEITAQQREAADREKKLAQALNLSNAEKASTQKELDDAKLSHAKLAEEHASVVKHLDIELGTARRNVVTAEDERAALQQKVDDLTNQNQELAKAFSLQRSRPHEREPVRGPSDDDFETATDNITPENSPPPSPVKGTPRHSMLESETIRSSLHHAQRTIQSQRSQLHREKTEKLELRRIIQDLRDDLEKARNDPSGATNARRNRKVDSKEFKKPAHLLGSLRSSRQDIMVDDPEWEDHGNGPHNSAHRRRRTAERVPLTTDGSDHFDTANEASESAFETANERATETEDFQTGNEDITGSDDGNATETEGASKGLGRIRRPPSLATSLGRTTSFHSTASTSADEDDLPELRTPTATLSSQRSRFRLRREQLLRNSRQGSEEPAVQSSPASQTSGGTPQVGGQSLFAELQDMGSEGETVGAATPSKRSTWSATPSSATHRPLSGTPVLSSPRKILMVDSGVMTDPVTVTIEPSGRRLERPTSSESVVYTGEHLLTALPRSPARPLSLLSNSDSSLQNEDIDVKLAEFPIPPTSPPAIRPPTPPPFLGLSHVQSEEIEPREEHAAPPTPPSLRLVSLAVEHVEPVQQAEMPLPPLGFSHIASETVDPLMQPESPARPLTMTGISSEAVEPLSVPPPVLSISTISAQALEPVAEPEMTSRALESQSVLPALQQDLSPPSAVLGFSGISAEDVLPISEPQPPPPALALSSIATQQTQPVMEDTLAPPALVFSTISAEDTQPVADVLSPAKLPMFGFSIIQSTETRPLSPRSPRRDAFILPRDSLDRPETPIGRALDSSLVQGKNVDVVPIFAEDDTQQSRRNSADAITTPESQRPFKELSNNTDYRPTRGHDFSTSDHGAQTSLTAGAIDQLIKGRPSFPFGHVRDSSLDSVDTPDTAGTVRIHRPEENMSTPVRSRAKNMSDAVVDAAVLPRSESTTSTWDFAQDAPPLPSNHRQAIESARSGSSHSQRQGSMGPPLWPASAMKHRPQTPSQLDQHQTVANAQFVPEGSAVHGTADVCTPGRATIQSRRSSVSSFASEIDSRFNMRPSEMGMSASNGLAPNTDPRMIQAITQTMIGEFLWKYTRKTGRGELSENRHRRYFWVHPYTRTLYWSDADPSTANRSELKAKSVPIEAVRVVTDDNPMPPGLHRKSMMIFSPGRTIKFTCTTGQRHETWFNALSYLLLRTDDEPAAPLEAQGHPSHITQEDVEEFELRAGGRQTGVQHEQKASPSLSSYNSHTTRNDSPAFDVTMNMPTLTPSRRHKQATHSASRASVGTLSKLSGYWRSGAPRLSGTLTSFRGKGTSGPRRDIYEASQAHDSAEDLRQMIERQDREASRLENVRACCDGRHDVGSLPHLSRRGRSYGSHGHPTTSVTNTPMASMSSRA